MVPMPFVLDEGGERVPTDGGEQVTLSSQVCKADCRIGGRAPYRHLKGSCHRLGI